jgi:RecA/RadA recombinase
MNGDLTAALLAAGSGTALAGAAVLHQRHLEQTMRASRVRVGLRFPAGLSVEAARAALGGLSGIGRDVELVFEVSADHQAVRHALLVPAPSQDAVVAALKAAIPSLRILPGRAETVRPAHLALAIRVGRASVLRTDAVETATAHLLGSLTGLGDGETVAVRWALRPSTAPRVPEPRDDEISRRLHRDWLGKAALPGFRATGLVVVVAASRSRAAELAERVASVVRGRARRGGHLRLGRARHRTIAAMPRTSSQSGWLNLPELTPLLAWPVDSVAVQGLDVGAARELPVPAHVGHSGRRLLIGRNAGGERPVALDARSALMHQLIVGGTGSGKSTVMVHAIVDDLASGYGGVVIDPKADLIQSVLERIPAEHAHRVVVLDPATTGPTVGLDLMGSGDPDLRADVVGGVLSAIFRDNWGQRADFYTRLGVRSLADVPGATLADFGRLFFEPAFRQAALDHLTDPWLVGSWQSYEALSPGEKAQHVQPAVAKIMALISRPAVRRVLAQPDPKLNLGRLLEERKLVLVSLAPGTLGEAAARLLGATIVYAAWSAIEARTAVSPAERHPAFVFVDELASLSSLPFGFELLAERARGLGAGLVVAAQTLGRVPESTRAALLGNVGSIVSFRASADEAARLAREMPGLSAEDLSALGAYEVAARVAAGTGTAVSVVTGRTEPLPATTGQQDRIRRNSAVRYGVDPAVIDAVLQRRLESQPEADEAGPLGRARRRT